jgi:hypothetical protein
VSHPRYDWWPYVKGMIRRYPELKAQDEELHAVSISPDLSGMPHGKGGVHDPVAEAALRELPEVNRRELAAVEQAIAATRALPNGAERMQLVRIVFWQRTHTLYGAADQIGCSARTAQQWHGEFIRAVAAYYGLL